MSQYPGHPPQGYPYQTPPQQPFSPQQGFGASPHLQQGAYNQTPPLGFAPQQYHQPPQTPPHGFGSPTPGQYGGHAQQWPPTPASPGYDFSVRIHGNASADATMLRKAMKGFGTDEKTLIRILSKPDPLQMTLLRETYLRDHGRDLESDVDKETSGYFRDTLKALIAGPLMQDVYNIKEAIRGIGTKEDALNDSLLGRSNADIRAIQAEYKKTFGVTLADDVRGDLSMKTKDLFNMVMVAQRAEESTPIYPDALERDVDDIHRATAGIPTDSITICTIFAYRSDGQLRAISHRFGEKYQTPLDKKIKGAISGHMEDALLLMLGRANDPVMTDAIGLEAAMAGAGTKDNLLLNRVVRAHWNRQHKEQVKRAYVAKYKTDLLKRIKSETSGDYERTLIACLE